MKKVELLSPAGSIDKLNVAYKFGADAVYIGGKAFNLRAKSSNFSKEAIKEAVDLAHSLNKKLYVALNILAHEREMKALPPFIRYLDEVGVDAVIVADLGILDLVTENSDLKIHVSTQASTTNSRAVKMWQKLGAKRVVLARECTIDEIKRIKDTVPEMELEVFVHGAMCMTYSGRCNLSSYFSNRDGNRGVCTSSCRWNYSVVEEKRPGEYFPVYEDETGSYMYNSKDLCTVEFLDKILEAGVDGLKIEGRMKSLAYCATTARVYRQALDSWLSGDYKMQESWLKELKAVSNRGYTSGFYFGELDSNSENLEGGYYGTHRFLGHVIRQTGENEYLIDVKDKIVSGLYIEVLTENVEIKKIKFEAKDVKNNESIEFAQPNMQVNMITSEKLNPFDVLRLEKAPI
jgi:U32 family peptidase